MQKSKNADRVKITKKEIENFKKSATGHINNGIIKKFTDVVWMAVGYFDDAGAVPIEVIEWAQKLAINEKIEF